LIFIAESHSLLYQISRYVGNAGYYNRMASCVFMLLAEFSSQFPKEAGELGIFVGAKTNKRRRVKDAGR
jgi:hypothetical protein